MDDYDEEITPPPPATPPYDIEFEVPCGKYSRDLVVRSLWTWTLFIDEVAMLMGCHASTLVLGYTLPWQTKANQKPVPKLLNEETFDKMKHDIDIWRSEQIAKNKKLGTVKHFIVKLFDLRSEHEQVVTTKVSHFSFALS